MTAQTVLVIDDERDVDPCRDSAAGEPVAIDDDALVRGNGADEGK